MKSVRYSSASGAIQLKDLALSGAKSGGASMLGEAGLQIKDLNAVRTPQGGGTDPRFDLSKTYRDVRFRVVDPLDGRVRPWGPYYAVKPLLSELNDPEVIAMVEARAASIEGVVVAGVASVSGVQNLTVTEGIGAPVVRVSGTDDGPMLDQIRLADAQVRMLYGMPDRGVGEPFFYHELQHPSVSDPSLLKITAPFFSGQRFWLRNPGGRGVPATDATGLGMLPSGELLVAKDCSPRAPQPAKAFEWKEERIQVLLSARGQTVPGPVIPHYCDLSVAQWWWRIGFALASDNSIVEALDKVSTITGRFNDAPSADGPEGWETQAAYVRALFECIARGYDAANIPWYIDPLARQLFRDWFAGHADNEFDPRSDYNAGYWFSTREQCGEKRFAVLRPRITPGADSLSTVGEMPARLTSMWRNLVSAEDQRTLEFVQKAGVLLWSGSATSDPYMAASAQNRGFASNLTMYGPSNELSGFWWDARAFARGTGSDPKSALTSAETGRLDSGSSPWNLWGNRPIARSFSDDWYAKLLHAPPLQPRDRISDWRAGGFDHQGVAGVHVQGTVPLRWYVAYAREWLQMLCQDDPVSSSAAPDMPSVRSDRRWSGFGTSSLPRRSVGEVLQQSLSNALQINLTWGSIYGSQQRLAQVLAEKSAEFGRSQPNRVIGAVSSATSSIGTAVGTALLPGVGSLIGVGIDTIGKILAAAIPEYVCDGYGRDDLGRAKPIFERTYLSGDPERGVKPSFSVSLPFGFCRTVVELPPILLVPDAPVRRDPVRRDQEEEKDSGSMAKVLVPVGLAVAGIAAVYFVSRSRRQE